MKHTSRRRPNEHRLPALACAAVSSAKSSISRRGLLALVFSLLVVVAAPGRGSFGALGSGPSKERIAVAATPYQAGRWALPSPVQMRATRLTQEIETLTAHPGHAASSKRLVALSRARQHALVRLLGKKPEAVGGLLLSRHARAVLSRIVGARVETRARVEGRHRVLHSDDFRDSTRDTFVDQLVTPKGKVFKLYGITSSVAVRLTFDRLKTGVGLVATGYMLGDRLLATKTKTLSGRALAATTAPTTGPTAVAVIAVNFSDSTTSVDMNAIEANFQGNPGQDVDSYFSEASYGKMTLVPSFYGPYSLAMSTSTGCGGSQTQSATMSAANADVDFTRFSRLIFVYNCPTQIGISGSAGPLSTPDGTITANIIAFDNTNATLRHPVVHELSHTLGGFNRHAAAYICQPDSFEPPTRFDPGCVSAEYGDDFDVLGNGPSTTAPQLDPFHKANAGWLDATQFPTVSVPGTYTFTLSPYEQASPNGQPVALAIPRGNTGTSFTVEYRQPIGFDAWMTSPSLCAHCTVTQGASIRLDSSAAGGGGGSDTQLIDTTPGTVLSYAYYASDDTLDGALLPGKTFTDPEYGISIATVSADSSGLTVRVTVPTVSCVHAAPTVGAPTPAMQTGGPGDVRTYTFTLTNNDTAGCPANTFRYFPPSGTAGLNLVATPDFVSLAPGASGTVSLAITPTALSLDGTYALTGSDGAGQFYSNSLGAGRAVVSGLTYQLSSGADTTTPGAPTGLAARALGSSAVALSWSAATDNVGVVGYQITRGTAAMFTTSALTLVDAGLWPGSTNTYSIRAFDRKGNLSTAATVTVTTPLPTDFTAPSTPTVTATASDHGLRISWTPSTDDVGVAYYQLSPCLVANCVLPATARSVTVDGLASRSKFDLEVDAYDGDGNVGRSATYTVNTAAGGDPAAPSQPTQVFVTGAANGQLQLSWAPSSDDGSIVGYDVYRNNRKVRTTGSASFLDTPGPGPHEFYVQAVDAQGSLSAPSLRVWFVAPFYPSDPSAPTAAITSPTDGGTVSGTATVTATPSDDVGVTRVELWVDGALKATSTSAPYSFAWDTASVSDGPHWIFARAYDAVGNYGTAAMTNLTVNNGTADTAAPSVAIVDPSSGTNVFGPTTITATASDDTAVTSVDIAVDNTTVATDTSAPYTATWDAAGASAGTHMITATARDAAGKSASATVNVVRSSPDTTPPTVSMVSPVDGASVSGTVLVQASASDDVGVSKVEFSVDGTAKSTDTISPWTFPLDTSTLAAGSHTLGVKAYDAAGNSSSAAVSVTVAAPADSTAPSTPSSLKALLLGTTQVVLTWTASKDNVGVVAYEIYRDGVKIDETSATNYLDSWLLPVTVHSYQVLARDSAGNRSALSSRVSAKTATFGTGTTGTLSGVVYNAQGKVLANVVVSVTVNGTTKTAKTNNNGIWKLTSVPAGACALTVTLTGYQPGTAAVTAVAGQTVLSVSVLSP
jgi:hypothetical protein